MAIASAVAWFVSHPVCLWSCGVAIASGAGVRVWRGAMAHVALIRHAGWKMSGLAHLRACIAHNQPA